MDMEIDKKKIRRLHQSDHPGPQPSGSLWEKAFL